MVWYLISFYFLLFYCFQFIACENWKVHICFHKLPPKWWKYESLRITLALLSLQWVATEWNIFKFSEKGVGCFLFLIYHQENTCSWDNFWEPWTALSESSLLLWLHTSSIHLISLATPLWVILSLTVLQHVLFLCNILNSLRGATWAQLTLQTLLSSPLTSVLI